MKNLERHSMEILINSKFRKGKFSSKDIEQIDSFYDHLRFDSDLNKVKYLFRELLTK